MNRLDIIKFIQDNQNDLLLDYYDKCYEKLNDINKKIDKLSLYLIVTTFLYFIASGTTISSIQIGPASISDISIILKVIPVLFAFILLQIIIYSSQKAELFTVVKLIFLANYKQGIDHKELDNDKNNLFTRLILPFSYSTELVKFSTRKKNRFSSCLGGILALPLIFLVFLPFYFEYHMLKTIWNEYYTTSIGKAAFWLSIWIIAYLLYFAITNFIENYKDAKKELA